jgi:hypothetical protein
MEERAARILEVRAAARQRGDWNLVRECDLTLGPAGVGSPEIETVEPAPVEVAVRRGPGRPRKTS